MENKILSLSLFGVIDLFSLGVLANTADLSFAVKKLPLQRRGALRIISSIPT